MTFDRAAISYDTDFTRAVTARWLRERVWERLDSLFQPGMRILEIGCGTGEDAVHLARRGVQVMATDASEGMLMRTREKAESAGIALTCTTFDLNDERTWILEGMFDGAYSNFGALNCTRNLSVLSAWLAEKIKPGGKLGFGVMGRFCLWETLWHGLHFDFRTASRRWSGTGHAVLADGSELPIYYPNPVDLQNAFGDSFEKTYLSGLGVFLPPSDIYPVIENRPRLHKVLVKLEAKYANRFLLRNMGDHYWLEMQRR